MPISRPLLLAAAALLAASTAQAQLKLPRPSQNAVVTQTIGTTQLSVTYSRPGVKQRAIWGALVPWDKPWRTGANEITQFHTSDDIRVEGQPLPAGTYGLVTIPGKDHWVVAFTKDKDLWGAFDYKPEHDQLRVTVTPGASAEAVEWMRFTIDPTTPNEADVALAWEKLRVAFHVVVDVDGRVLASARAAVDTAKADDWRTRYNAASWAFGRDLAAADARGWAGSALKIKENFQTLSLVARMSAKAGDTKQASAQMTKAIALGKADKDVEAEQLAPMEKLLADWGTK